MTKREFRSICKALGEDPALVSVEGNTFSVGHREYLVCTDQEVDQFLSDSIADSLWAFNPDFLAGETGIDELVFRALQPNCESANPAVRAIVDATCGLASLVRHAECADGRGHFLSGYDGVELDILAGRKTFYAYRVN